MNNGKQNNINLSLAFGVHSLLTATAILKQGNIMFVVVVVMSPLFACFLIYCLAYSTHYDDIFNGIIKEILIPEFIDKDPLEKLIIGKKDKILQETLRNVNSKVYDRMGVHYGYVNIRNLLSAYNWKITNFEGKYLEHYEDISAEEIQISAFHRLHRHAKLALVNKNISLKLFILSKKILPYF